MNHQLRPAPVLALLAAGGSRRLGQPKQLLRQHGVPAVRRLALAALELPFAKVIVVLGAHSAPIRAVLQDLPVQLLDNPQWELGLASSVHAVVAHLDTWRGACVFATVDQPALERLHLQAILDVADQYPDHDIASGYNGVVGSPALLRRSSWIHGLQLQGDTGLRALLRRDPERLITVPAADLGLDIDTPEQWRQAIQLGWLDPAEDFA